MEDRVVEIAGKTSHHFFDGGAMDELRAVACNYIVSTPACRKGAKAFVMWTNPGSGGERVRILARSRGGRWIEKFEDARYLANFRVVTVVDAQAHYYRLKDRAYPTDGACSLEEFAARMQARQYHGAERPIGADSRARP